MRVDRYDEISEAMRSADDDPLTLVAHPRVHQLIAPEPLSALSSRCRRSEEPARSVLGE